MKPELNFIGYIETPFVEIEDCPRNIESNGPSCQIILYEEYQDGLVGLHHGQQILILYWLDKTDRTAICQESGKDKNVMGTFALRSPHRPNPIGAAVLTIEEIEAGQITVRGLDCLNNTKLIDIKPAIDLEADTLDK